MKLLGLNSIIVMSICMQLQKAGGGVLQEACWGKGEGPLSLKEGVKRESIGHYKNCPLPFLLVNSLNGIKKLSISIVKLLKLEVL